MATRGSTRGVRRTARWSAVIVAMLMVTGLSACGGSIFDRPKAPCVARDCVIGDSITWELDFHKGPEMRERWANNGWDYGAYGWPGARVGAIRADLQQTVARVPNIRHVFLNIGANDATAISKEPGGTAAGAILQLNGAAHDVIDEQPDACLLLVTLTYRPGDNNAAPGTVALRRYNAVRDLNAHMYELEEEYPNIHVIDWAAHRKAEYFAIGQDGQRDWIHLSKLGMTAIGQLYARVANEEC